jgi:hypothetical protein
MMAQGHHPLRGAALPSEVMASHKDPEVVLARQFLDQATQSDQVGYASGRQPARELLRWITRGRLGTRSRELFAVPCLSLSRRATLNIVKPDA